MKRIFRFIVLSFLVAGCQQASKENNSTDSSTNGSEVNKINVKAQEVRDYVSKNAVIAHRGSTYWAPEETEPAFRWARNIGADYLELDLQMTKDSVIIALHDNDLSRTTNVAEVFPERAYAPVVEFTLQELRSLDVGSWFNEANPNRARDGFNGQTILTFKDVVMIAEGYRIKRADGVPVKVMVNNNWTGLYAYEKDPQDNGNRPGIYAETKKPDFEKRLANELKTLGWDITHNAKKIPTIEGKVTVANTNGRFVLQSFSRGSIQELEKLLPNIPKCLLLWYSDMKDSLKQNYVDAVNFGVENNVHFIGPSITGEPNNYAELTAPWMIDLIHASGMYIHPYTFDTETQLAKYAGRVEGVFTNRADLALAFYNRLGSTSAVQVLDDLGY